MGMDLNEYQMQARETAIYPTDKAVIYPLLGLMGEVGEFANKYKKVIRDGNKVDPGDQADELGDIAWYIANLADDMGIHMNELEYHDTPVEPPSIAESIIDLFGTCGKLADNYTLPMPRLLVLLRYIWMDFKTLCDACELDLEAVLMRNIHKLSDRKSRGVLGGSGDKR